MLRLRNLTAAISLAAIVLSGCAGSKAVRNGNECPDFTQAEKLDLKKIAEIASKLPYNASKEDKIRAFNMADCAHKKNVEDMEIALILARASYMVADIEEKDSLVEKFAAIGKDAIESLNMVMDSPKASYFYATNLGLLVKIEGLFGIKKIPLLIDALNNAQKDPSIDQGGPLRTLGMLYLKTPQSLGGDIDKALDLLERAATDYPEHPQNHYFYSEALIEDGDDEGARAELAKAKKLLNADRWGTDYVKRWKTDIEKIEKRLK